MLKSEIISIDYVKSKRNLADLMTKHLGRNMILETLRGMRLKPIANKQVIVTQPLWLEIPWIRFIWVKASHLLVMITLNWFQINYVHSYGVREIARGFIIERLNFVN